MAKFQKGNPGGPGRPLGSGSAGSRNAVNRLLDDLVSDDGAALSAVLEAPRRAFELVGRANGGD